MFFEIDASASHPLSFLLSSSLSLSLSLLPFIQLPYLCLFLNYNCHLPPLRHQSALTLNKQTFFLVQIFSQTKSANAVL